MAAQLPLLTGYTLMPELLVCPFNEWEQYVQNAWPEKHGVAWVYWKCYPHDGYTNRAMKYQPDDANDAQLEFNGRGAPNKGIVFVINYQCHRAGNKRVHQARACGEQSTKARHVQKESEHIGCNAKLKAVYSKDDPEHVRLEVTYGRYDAAHNHIPGSATDVSFLPMSNTVKEMGQKELENGYGQRKVRLAMRREFRDHWEVYSPRDAWLNSKEV